MQTDARRATGALGERIAERHLERAGYEIVERNYRSRYGELDLVAADARCLVFCEVKTRVGTGRSGPAQALDAIGPRKRRRVRAMAMQWLNADEYINQLKQGGFARVEAFHEVGCISVDAWRDLGQYWLFIEGALPGVPLPLGAAALEAAVYQAGQELGITETPRNWLQLIAYKA